MSTDKTQKDLQEFLNNAKVVKVDPEKMENRLESIFGQKKGQLLVDLAIKSFERFLDVHQETIGDEVTQNDKANILARSMIVLELAGFININVSKNYAKRSETGSKRDAGSSKKNIVESERNGGGERGEHEEVGSMPKKKRGPRKKS